MRATPRRPNLTSLRAPSAICAASALLGAVLAAACGGETEPAADPAVARGEQIYKNVCIACHAADPSQDGSLGPAVAGASRELLEAKVLRGEYPPGYAPRRPGGVMPQYPYVAERIGDLAAYLARKPAD